MLINDWVTTGQERSSAANADFVAILFFVFFNRHYWYSQSIEQAIITIFSICFTDRL